MNENERNSIWARRPFVNEMDNQGSVFLVASIHLSRELGQMLVDVILDFPPIKFIFPVVYEVLGHLRMKRKSSFCIRNGQHESPELAYHKTTLLLQETRDQQGSALTPDASSGHPECFGGR